MLQFKDFDIYHVKGSLMSEMDLYHNALLGVQDPLIEQTKRFPLLSYASRYWCQFDIISSESHVVKGLQSFFQSFQGNYFRLAAGPWTVNSRRALPNASGLLPLKLPPLHHYIQIGDFPKTVFALIASGANVNELDIDGMSPLHWACARGNKSTITALLSNPRLNPNVGLPGKHRPIHMALEWLSRRSRGPASIEIPLLILNDGRTNINVAEVGQIHYVLDLDYAKFHLDLIRNPSARLLAPRW